MLQVFREGSIGMLKCIFFAVAIGFALLEINLL